MGTKARAGQRRDSGPSIKLTRGAKLSINWKQLTRTLTETAAQGFLTALGGNGVSAGISALIGAVGSVKIDSEPGEKVWSLAVLCFAWALDELRALPGVDDPALRIALAEALAEARKSVDDDAEFAPITFLERPTTLPLYRALRDAMVGRRESYRAGIYESDEALRARFDSAYDRAMFEVMSRRPDIYQSLATVFSLPAAAAAQSQSSWDAYRKRLIFEFEVRSVFGQETTKVSLSQLYVPLRGYWRREGLSPADLARGRLNETHHVCRLDDELDKWIRSASDDDAIRLIGGGPGSGKSTTLRAFARRIADRPEWRVLYIPLQYIDLEGDFREAINRHFVDRTSGAFSQPPLSRGAIEDGPPLLLIFDGLDELARPGEAANEVVSLFSTKLTNLVSSLRGDRQKSVRVVVSGRMPSFQAAKRHISPPGRGCIEVYGFTPLKPIRSEKIDSLWAEDQRISWWRQYAALVGASPEIPPAFTSQELRGLTHEPLLCYLLVLSGFANENWEQAAENPNRIYKTLVDSIWHRGWGEGARKRQGPGRTLSKVDFNVLMQTIALAAWQGGDTRVASEQGFSNAIKIARAEDAWERFKQDNGPDVTNLAMNFYLKASESVQRGFEFTHKSFGDYLAARAILKFANELPTLINRKIDYAMTDWVEATGTGALTSEILTFLRDEVRLKMTEPTDPIAIDDIISLKCSFERFVSRVLADGLPASAGAPSWRAAESKQRNGEIMAWAVLNALSLAIASVGRPEKLVAVEWPEPLSSFNDLIRRVVNLGAWDNPVLRCFSFIKASNCFFYCLPMVGIDLRGARLKDVVFSSCSLYNANFEGASLDGSKFYNSALNEVKFDSASLVDVELHDVNLEGASWNSVTMKNTTVTELTLLRANLDVFKSHKSELRYGRSDFMPIQSNFDTDTVFGAVPAIRKLISSIWRQYEPRKSK